MIWRAIPARELGDRLFHVLHCFFLVIPTEREEKIRIKKSSTTKIPTKTVAKQSKYAIESND